MGDSSVDITIIGAGFAGSLAALCLHRAGFRVILVEKDKHPRFAIGESSTPIADMIIRKLSETYNLPWLNHFSRYGSWQEHNPEITCGIKRGFSYYGHTKHQTFMSSRHHSRELLVAASRNDRNSDTNWLRSDVDAFLVKKVIEAGIPYYENTTITSCHKNEKKEWHFECSTPEGSREFRSPFFIDATGSPHFLHKFLNIESTSDDFETQSLAVFSHFENTDRWSEVLARNNHYTEDYPFDPDHSALHHLLDEGWMWMIRFNNNLLSSGVVIDLAEQGKTHPPASVDSWNQLLKGYPSLQKVFKGSRLADPPGKMITSGRLQRKLHQTYGDGWVALNHTSGFVDPLHSTGIAHTLSGLEQILNILNHHFDNKDTLHQKFDQLQSAFFKELRLIDHLVAGCYQARKNVPLFTAFSMLYFTCTIHYEQQRLTGAAPSHFLSADNRQLVRIVESSYRDLQHLLVNDHNPGQIERYTDEIRQKIKPYNRAGLLDDSKNNMYTHTAVKL